MRSGLNRIVARGQTSNPELLTFTNQFVELLKINFEYRSRQIMANQIKPDDHNVRDWYATFKSHIVNSAHLLIQWEVHKETSLENNEKL